MLLHYDGNDRLIKVTTEENGQVTSAVTYAYDADGNRIQTNADGEVTQYVVDSNDSLAQVVAELDANNQVNVAYLHGDDLISQYRGNDISYYHYDGLGSTRALTAPNATVTNTYDYEAFGELTAQTGETENNYLYTGEQIDPNTGNYYLRARYYNPDTGGFLSMDSFDGVPQDPVTLHKYLYANGNPVNMVDPSGYFAFSLGGLSMGNTIRGILTTMNRVDKVLNILDVVTDPTGAVTDKLSNKAMGALVILGRLGKSTQKVFLRLTSSCRSKKNSFTAGTLVHTERGLVPIEKIRIGDFVLSYHEQTGQEQSNEVIHLIQGQQEYELIILTLDSGETIETTADHPFYIKGKGFYPANTLKVGQALQLRNSTVVVIQEISTETRFETVYNLTVANIHNYFVGQDGVLVHNCEKTIVLYHGTLGFVGDKFDLDQAKASKRSGTPKPGIYLTEDFIRAAQGYGRGGEVIRLEVPKSYADSVFQFGGPNNNQPEYFVDTQEGVDILNKGITDILPTNKAICEFFSNRF
jgi:RHS repeat-associated protein